MKNNRKISEDILDNLADRIRVTKRIYRAWEEINSIQSSTIKLRNIKKQLLTRFGKYQYFYENSKGKISLIHLFGRWETYSFNTLFEGTRSFDFKSEAEKEILIWLDNKIGRRKK